MGDRITILATIREAGEEQSDVTLPEEIRMALNLEPGSTVRLTVVGGSVVLEPLGSGTESLRDSLRTSDSDSLRSRPRKLRLEDLLAQCDPEVAFSEEDRSWLDDSPVGREQV
jgi:AbrB family looped-hinge helix DNA binding protein